MHQYRRNKSFWKTAVKVFDEMWSSVLLKIESEWRNTKSQITDPGLLWYFVCDVWLQVFVLLGSTHKYIFMRTSTVATPQRQRASACSSTVFTLKRRISSENHYIIHSVFCLPYIHLMTNCIPPWLTAPVMPGVGAWVKMVQAQPLLLRQWRQLN